MATVAIIGVFYVVVSAIEVMGFGTSAAGLKNFSNSPALLGTLGRTYVANWFGDLIIAGTVISAFGCSMASALGPSRLIFSFARDGISPEHPMARLSPRYGSPVAAVTLVVAVEVLCEVVLGGIVGTKPIHVFAWAGEIGTLLVLVAYLLVTIGATWYLFIQPYRAGEPLRARGAELAIPILAIAVVIYTVYRNVVPYPTGANAWLPVVAGIWLVLAVVGVLAAPASSRRLGEALVLDEGMHPGDAPDDAPRPVTIA